MSSKESQHALKARLRVLTDNLLSEIGRGRISQNQVAEEVTELHEKFHWYRVMLDENLLEPTEILEFQAWAAEHGFDPQDFMPR